MALRINIYFFLSSMIAAGFATYLVPCKIIDAPSGAQCRFACDDKDDLCSSDFYSATLNEDHEFTPNPNCGKRDTAEFKASDSCCNCGGGVIIRENDDKDYS